MPECLYVMGRIVWGLVACDNWSDSAKKKIKILKWVSVFVSVVLRSPSLAFLDLFVGALDPPLYLCIKQHPQGQVITFIWRS